MKIFFALYSLYSSSCDEKCNYVPVYVYTYIETVNLAWILFMRSIRMPFPSHSNHRTNIPSLKYSLMKGCWQTQLVDFWVINPLAGMNTKEDTICSVQLLNVLASKQTQIYLKICKMCSIKVMYNYRQSMS